MNNTLTIDQLQDIGGIALNDKD
ncbi:hypothetical protein StPhP954_gp43 [Staphylococcus phage P954]|uniref:Uncharacterized protein n=1 Tax=Staphylococcus phage P954 TaxID=668618 RepID=C8CH14_9CAUD|nr:hypothetical protein StPhP954_gp43 [Staphylococcus phage P954]ACV04984.1 hypothetical protein [Staphylococcus phage P954]